MRSPRPSIAPVLVAGLLVLALLLVGPEQVKAGTPVEGQIVTDTTWTLAGSPYWVEGDVVVLSTANLTLEPGVRVLFDGPFAIYVEGELFAVGSPASIISFTSNLSEPSPGDWRGLQVNATGRALIRHTDVTFATHGVRVEGSSSNQVSNSLIADNLEAGVSIMNGSEDNRIDQNRILTNGDGVRIELGSLTVISGNNISFNDNGLNCGIGCDDSVIEENYMHMNGYHAVRIEGKRNVIRNNSMSENGHAGTRWNSYWCYDGSIYNEEAQSAVYSIGWENALVNNTIEGTIGIGVAIDCGGQAVMSGNLILDNDAGVSVFASSHQVDLRPKIELTRNVIMNNDAGLEFHGDYARGSSVQNTDFIGNAAHVHDIHIGNTYFRNFWSGYSETCEDWWRSGLCSLPYLVGFDEGAVEVIEDTEPVKFPNVWRGPSSGHWPVVDAGGPYTGDVGEAIHFDGTVSYDPDGTIVTYSWDFGDGNFGTGPTPEWAYWWPGTFSVLLVVWDDDYMWGMCNTTATIAEEFSLPHNPQPSRPVSGTPVPLPGP
jgi:hypothetical protein